MFSEEFLRRYPEIVKAFEELRLEIQHTRRPPTETIIDDCELRSKLNISQRTAATWRESRLLTYSKVGNKIYYKLSDVLNMIERHRIPSMTENLKLDFNGKVSKKL